MKTMLLGVVAALAMLCGRAEAAYVTIDPGTYDILGLTEDITVFSNLSLIPGELLTNAGVTVPQTDRINNYTNGYLTGRVGYQTISSGWTTQIGNAGSCRSGCYAPSLFVSLESPQLTFTSSGSIAYFINNQLAGSDTIEVRLSLDLPAGVSLSPVPLPAALPLFASVLGLGGWLASRRRVSPRRR